jgi:hypothetical protein
LVIKLREGAAGRTVDPSSSTPVGTSDRIGSS